MQDAALEQVLENNESASAADDAAADTRKGSRTRDPVPWTYNYGYAVVCIQQFSRIQESTGEETFTRDLGELDKGNERGVCCCLCPIQTRNDLPADDRCVWRPTKPNSSERETQGSR